MKILAIVLAVICFVAAGLYGTGHFPGTHHKVHVTHAAAFGILGLLALVWSRMQGSSSTAPRA
jgi:hypothetical protein